MALAIERTEAALAQQRAKLAADATTTTGTAAADVAAQTAATSDGCFLREWTVWCFMTKKIFPGAAV